MLTLYRVSRWQIGGGKAKLKSGVFAISLNPGDTAGFPSGAGTPAAAMFFFHV